MVHNDWLTLVSEPGLNGFVDLPDWLFSETEIKRMKSRGIAFNHMWIEKQ
jgi:hypothetical protein